MGAGGPRRKTVVLKRQRIDFLYAAELVVQIDADRNRPPAESVAPTETVQAARALVHHPREADMRVVAAPDIGGRIGDFRIRQQIDPHFPPFEHRKIELHIAQTAARALIAQRLTVHVLPKRVHIQIETDVEHDAQRIDTAIIRGRIERRGLTVPRKPDGDAAHPHGARVEIRHFATDAQSGIRRKDADLRTGLPQVYQQEKAYAYRPKATCLICYSPISHSIRRAPN